MIDGMHDIAARGFAAAADAYEHARPAYPTDAVSTIVDRLDLRPGRTVLELGAGTGKLTRLLIPSGARVMALEPVEAMRAKLTATTPGAELIGGTAESIPLATSSVDAVVAAQAFHWFDAIRALSEIHRVLRPGGRLLLAWNFRDETVPWVKELGELTHRLIRGEPQAWHRTWRDALARCALFPPFDVAMFRHVHPLTPDAVVDRVASVSYIAAADPAARAEILDEVAALLARDPATAGRATIGLPYTTEIMWAERRSPFASTTGIVASVNLNRGGVPKPPVDGAQIIRLGLEGDGHDNPEPVHGGPDQAVSLYSQEAIERVRADGHAAFPGAYGENLTLLGIDWSRLHAGDRLVIGDETDGDDGVMLELTDHAAPCQTIARWFVDRRIGRISPASNPGDARWYARVLREGPVAPGMAVRVAAAN